MLPCFLPALMKNAASAPKPHRADSGSAQACPRPYAHSPRSGLMGVTPATRKATNRFALMAYAASRCAVGYQPCAQSLFPCVSLQSGLGDHSRRPHQREGHRDGIPAGARHQLLVEVEDATKRLRGRHGCPWLLHSLAIRPAYAVDPASGIKFFRVSKLSLAEGVATSHPCGAILPSGASEKDR